jgi:hypothetical protein
MIKPTLPLLASSPADSTCNQHVLIRILTVTSAWLNLTNQNNDFNDCSFNLKQTWKKNLPYSRKNQEANHHTSP